MRTLRRLAVPMLIAGAAVVGFTAPAQAHPSERIAIGLSAQSCNYAGYYGKQAGQYTDYWCYQRPGGYELWVHYAH